MKLLLADDHALFRDALVQYIERFNSDAVVTLAENLNEALEHLEKDPEQDLIVLDLRMPGMDGLNGFKLIRDRFPSQRVALMSGVAEAHDVEKVLAMGACGYFPKTMSGKALLKAIQQVVAGDVFVPEGRETRFMQSYYADNMPPAHLKNVNFTPREKDVLEFLVDGASNKEIARALDLQVVTVKLHVSGICRKLGAKNRTQAALMAKDMGVSAASLV